MAKDTESNELGTEWVRKDSEQWDEIREAFMIAQDQKCAICREPFYDLPHVDHCHASGFVRGVLCGSCNVKLGWLEKRRHAIDLYLAKAAEFQAHRIKPKSVRILGRQLARSKGIETYGAPEWVRRYWQEKAAKQADALRNDTP